MTSEANLTFVTIESQVDKLLSKFKIIFAEKTESAVLVAHLSDRLHCRHRRHRDTLHSNERREARIAVVFEKLSSSNRDNSFHFDFPLLRRALDVFLVERVVTSNLSTKGKS